MMEASNPRVSNPNNDKVMHTNIYIPSNESAFRSLALAMA
jgi:hypothetical protein